MTEEGDRVCPYMDIAIMCCCTIRHMYMYKPVLLIVAVVVLCHYDC